MADKEGFKKKDKDSGIAREDLKPFNLKAGKNQRDLFDWIDKAIKSRRYAIHITVLNEKCISPEKSEFELENINLITDMPVEDIINAVRSFKEHVDREHIWR